MTGKAMLLVTWGIKFLYPLLPFPLLLGTIIYQPFLVFFGHKIYDQFMHSLFIHHYFLNIHACVNASIGEVAIFWVLSWYHPSLVTATQSSINVSHRDLNGKKWVALITVVLQVVLPSSSLQLCIWQWTITEKLKLRWTWTWVVESGMGFWPSYSADAEPIGLNSQMSTWRSTDIRATRCYSSVFLTS